MPISSNQDWSERHRSAVRGSAPEVPGLSEGEQRALWHQIEARVAPAEVRRARWKTVAAGVVAVVAVGGVGAAAANVLSARTGTFPVAAEGAGGSLRYIARTLGCAIIVPH